MQLPYNRVTWLVLTWWAHRGWDWRMELQLWAARTGWPHWAGTPPGDMALLRGQGHARAPSQAQPPPRRAALAALGGAEGATRTSRLPRRSSVPARPGLPSVRRAPGMGVQAANGSEPVPFQTPPVAVSLTPFAKIVAPGVPNLGVNILEVGAEGFWVGRGGGWGLGRTG